MNEQIEIASLEGITLRWVFVDGPTAETTYEHDFHEDGTVTWRVMDGPMAGRMGVEKECALVKIARNVHAASYLGESGYTLTVVLNFETGEISGFASNDEEWHAMSGEFAVV